MVNTYFLGANTPKGFHSEYAALQSDPRIQRLYILKGGSGCGKSTLMKTVAARAEARGLDVERVLCSGDPGSLDGVLVPALGVALVDGTAPHVIEPELCGCGARYLDLGAFYDMDRLDAAASKLREKKEQNRKSYLPAYGCLRGAGAVLEVVRGLAAPALDAQAQADCLARLLPQALRPGAETGQVRRCFRTAVTADGLLSLRPDCTGLWSLEDSFGLGAGLLRRLARAWTLAGYDVILALDPMEPRDPAALSIPASGVAYVRSDRLFALGRDAVLKLDLDALAARALSDEQLAELRCLLRRAEVLVRDAVRWLERAKQHHDALEALYRPAVDFHGLAALTEELCGEIFG